MPKSSKKRKDKVADFTKAKLKLGKGKQVANNAVDTSFKARSIVLPNQSIAAEKDASIPVTKRNLSFEDLISNLKHYNTAIRRDAIMGLRELLESHWELLDSNLTTLVKALVRVIGDEDAGVRKAFLSFFAWLLPRIPSVDLIPHAPILLLFTTSAQTHIFPEIRIDAVRFLDILLDRIPRVITSGLFDDKQSHGSRVLEGYLGILNAGTKYGETDGPPTATSSASVILTHASKLIVMASLSAFLQHALVPDDMNLYSSTDRSYLDPTKPIHAWYLKGAFTTEDAFKEFEELVQPQISNNHQNKMYQQWQSHEEPEEGSQKFLQPVPLAGPSSERYWMLEDLTNLVEGPASRVGSTGFLSNSTVTFVRHLARTLHSTLIANFLDYAPLVFSFAAAPLETEVALVVTAARIVHCLYKFLLQESETVPEVHREELTSILAYMTPYFPACSAGNRTSKSERSFEEYNLIFCELISLLVITSHSKSSRSSRKEKAQEALLSLGSSKRNGRDLLPKQTAAVSDFIVEKIQGRVGSSRIATMIGPSAYRMLLPTIWASINSTIQGEDKTNNVLVVALEHATRMTTKAAGKRLTIEFISRLILLNTHPQYRGNFRIGRSHIEDQKFEAWLLHLPQVLWELGNSDLMTTETILRALLRILQRKSRLIHTETVSQLQGRMTPYFCINHVVRGQHPGPYSKLPTSSPVRRLALDVMATLQVQGRRGSVDTDQLSSAVLSATKGTGDEKYWLHVGMSFSDVK